MTQSLGSYTFLDGTPCKELTGVRTSMDDKIDEQQLAEGNAVTSHIGSGARRWHLKGFLITNGGTTYLDKMSTIEGMRGDVQTYTDTVHVPDASNQVDVYIRSISWEGVQPRNATFAAYFSITLVEALG